MPNIKEVVYHAYMAGEDPVNALLDYMAEKDSPMPRYWAENRVEVFLSELRPKIVTVRAREDIWDAVVESLQVLAETDVLVGELLKELAVERARV